MSFSFKSVVEARRCDAEKWKENESVIRSTVSEMKVKLVTIFNIFNWNPFPENENEFQVFIKTYSM